MMNKPSVKHHYLPQYYLKGFTDGGGQFFVYDKKGDKVFKTNPANTFFEKHLNTVSYPDGKTSDFIEKMYTEMENQSWSFLDIVRGSSHKDSIDELTKMQLYLFLQFLYWRLPNNAKAAEGFASMAFESGNIIDYFSLKNKDGSKAPPDLSESIRSSPAFQKTMKLLVPFAPFFKEENWIDSISNWRFLYSGDTDNWHMVGDNPLIMNQEHSSDPVRCLKQFVFPISGRVLLVNLDPPISQGAEGQVILQHNLAMIERAERFVACGNEDLLNLLVKFHKFYVAHGKNQLLVTNFLNGLRGDTSI